MMHIHLVFVTKYRRHVFDADVEVRPLTLSAGTSSNSKHPIESLCPLARAALSFPAQFRHLWLQAAAQRTDLDGAFRALGRFNGRTPFLRISAYTFYAQRCGFLGSAGAQDPGTGPLFLGIAWRLDGHLLQEQVQRFG